MSANERVALGEIVLQIGKVSETVSVTEEAAQVQLDTSKRSGELTTNHLANLTAWGLKVVSMRRISGVQYQADQDSAGGSYGTSTPQMGGAFLFGQLSHTQAPM